MAVVKVKSFNLLPDGGIEVKEEKEINVKSNDNKVKKKKPSSNSKASQKS
jgi:hypothetical protein|tara:strand:- start:34840 stop:34989 length:150 start_codon:yes stop_codon:yes gene_type:complete